MSVGNGKGFGLQCEASAVFEAIEHCAIAGLLGETPVESLPLEPHQSLADDLLVDKTARLLKGSPIEQISLFPFGGRSFHSDGDGA